MVICIPKLMAPLVVNSPLTMMAYITGSPENSVGQIIVNCHFLVGHFLYPTLFFVANDNSHPVQPSPFFDIQRQFLWSRHYHTYPS